MRPRGRVLTERARSNQGRIQLSWSRGFVVLYSRAQCNRGRILTKEIRYVILRTNRARCVLNKENVDLLISKAFLECTVVELVYKFDDKSTTSV